MSGADIVALISGIISVISFALFVLYFVVYRILEHSADKTETTIGYYEKIKKVTDYSKTGYNTHTRKRFNTYYAIYSYTVNGRMYRQKIDMFFVNKAPKEITVTYIRRLPRFSMIKENNLYWEKYFISAIIFVFSLALMLLAIFVSKENMEKEIIIPRKKSKSIGYAILMLLTTSMFVFLAVIKFANISWINADNVPLLLVILSLICAPICAYCFIHYLKEIFNNNPALIINQNGIHEQLSKFSVGMIKWDDIENINIVPYMDNTYFICILLKNPAKYIENQKRLDKLSKRKSTQKWGHINFSTLYFKKEFNSVVELIRYYMKENNIISDK